MEINFDPERIKKLLENMENSQLKKIGENFDDEEENLGAYSSGFDAGEMDGDALAAAMADFEKDGVEFTPLGQSKYEKDLDIDQMKADLSADNLNLPKRKAELSKHQNALDRRYKHEKRFGVGSLNEWTPSQEGPQPGDSEYHSPKSKKALEGLSKFNDIDWKSLHSYISSNDAYASDLTDPNEGMMSYADLNLLRDFNIIDVNSNHVIFSDDNYMIYDTFLQAVQSAWQNATKPTNNKLTFENEGQESEFAFDTKDLYSFLQDAFEQLSFYNEAEAAKILEEELLKHFNVTPKSLSEGSVERIKDANGVDITNRARVIYLATGAVGNVLHPGINDNGQQTIHVAWQNIPLAQAPPKEVLPSDIAVEDDTRIVREATSRSISNGRSANGRPNVFPGYFERDVDNKDLTNTEKPEIDLADQKPDSALDINADAKKLSAPIEDPLDIIIPKSAPDKIKYTMYEKEKLETGENFDAIEKEEEKKEVEDIDQYEDKEIDIDISNPEKVDASANYSEKRVDSVMEDLKEGIETKRIKNNKIIACDYLDKKWVFNIKKVDENKVYLDFEGCI